MSKSEDFSKDVEKWAYSDDVKSEKLTDSQDEIRWKLTPYIPKMRLLRGCQKWTDSKYKNVHLLRRKKKAKLLQIYQKQWNYSDDVNK